MKRQIPDDTMQSVKLQATFSRLGTALLLAQPFFTFPVFLSVLQGEPPLGFSWLIAVIPLPLRFFITGRLTCRTPFDIPILNYLQYFKPVGRRLKNSLNVLDRMLGCVEEARGKGLAIRGVKLPHNPEVHC